MDIEDHVFELILPTRICKYMQVKFGVKFLIHTKLQQLETNK